MRLSSSAALLVVAVTGLLAQSAEERCTVRFAGKHCEGLGCSNQAVIVFGEDKAGRVEVVNLEYPSSSDNNHLGSPEAVTAKALLQLGKQGWELESVSPESEPYPNSAGAVYHLKRRVQTK